jgi:hypothetical protein
METERTKIRRYAAQLADSSLAGEKLIAGFINQHLQIYGENASVGGVERALQKLIQSATDAIIAVEKCRDR